MMSSILETPAIPTAPSLLAQLDDELQAVYQRVRASVVLLYRHGGNGAGVIWRSDGIIVTNNHVVAGDGKMNVVLADGRTYLGIVAQRHPTRDLAVVKIAENNLPAIAYADSTKVRAGEIALAIGHPLGYRDAITAGIVVAPGNSRIVEGSSRGDFIQTDARFAPGVSGGPLVNHRGEVIGIATRVSGDLGIAVPSSAVRDFVGAGIGQARGSIGVTAQLTPLRNQRWAHGLLLVAVPERSPADQAGLIIGDVIVEVDGKVIEDQETLPAALMRVTPGERLTLTVLHGGDPAEVQVLPQIQPIEEAVND